MTDNAPASSPAVNNPNTAGKGMVIFGFWAIVQMLLVVSLYNLRTTEDLKGLGYGLSREAAIRVQDIALEETLILMKGEKALEQRQAVDASVSGDLQELKSTAISLKRLYSAPEDQELVTQIVQDSDEFVRCVDQVRLAAGASSFLSDIQVRESKLRKSLRQLVGLKRLPIVPPSLNQFLTDSFWYITAIALGLANMLGLVSIGFFFIRRTIDRVLILTENSSRLSRGARLLAPLSGSDEVAQLDQEFHKMADALTRAAQTEQALFENTSDVLCHLDSSYHVLNVNKSAQRVLGYNPSSLLGMRITDIVYQPDRASVIEQLKAASMKRAQVPFEVRLVQENSSILHTLWSVRYVREEESYFCVVHDISERKEADELRRQVVQMVNRDLQTPLSVIQQVYARFTTDSFAQLSEKGKHNLASARLGTDRMLRLIGDLLDLERLEAGTLTIKCDNVWLPDVASESLEGVAMLAQQKKITLERHCPGLIVFADRHRLVQVLINLLGNAIKFSPEGGKITVAAQESSGFVEISVLDQGRGVPAHLTKAIFERFRQVQTSDATVKGGSGLGLAICKALVEMHGGEIGVESKEGQGSRFFFRIPLSARA